MQRVFLLYLSASELSNFDFRKTLKVHFFRITSGAFIGRSSPMGFNPLLRGKNAHSLATRGVAYLFLFQKIIIQKMKKLLSVCTLLLLLTMTAKTQNSQQELQSEMEKMMQQMQEMMKSFGSWMGEVPIFMDTTLVREFHFPAEEFDGMMEQIPMDDLSHMFFQFSPDSLMNGDMFKGMEQLMEQWSIQGFSDMEDFFKELEKLAPTSPENDGTPQDKEAAPNKKKRKTTTL
jgi:hypothetical protein